MDTPATPRTVFSLSERETYEFGRAIGRQLGGGDLLLLEGELGAGKTVFARGVAAGLDIEPESVSSPSFTLIHEHRGGRLTMYHVDLYRISAPDELATLGLEDLLSPATAVVAEWGERLPPFYRRRAVTVRLHDIGEGSRRIEILPAAEDGDEPETPDDA